MTKNTAITRLTPHGKMDILSQLEVSQLRQGSQDDGLYETFRRCSPAWPQLSEPGSKVSTIAIFDLGEENKVVKPESLVILNQ